MSLFGEDFVFEVNVCCGAVFPQQQVQSHQIAWPLTNIQHYIWRITFLEGNMLEAFQEVACYDLSNRLAKFESAIAPSSSTKQ
jgi:hypothetical protein